MEGPVVPNISHRNNPNARFTFGQQPSTAIMEEEKTVDPEPTVPAPKMKRFRPTDLSIDTDGINELYPNGGGDYTKEAFNVEDE